MVSSRNDYAIRFEKAKAFILKRDKHPNLLYFVAKKRVVSQVL